MCVCVSVCVCVRERDAKERKGDRKIISPKPCCDCGISPLAPSGQREKYTSHNACFTKWTYKCVFPCVCVCVCVCVKV